MRILIIDNNIDADSWGSPDLRRCARLAQGATIHVRRAPQGDLPESPSGYDRIIVSGSKTSALEDAPWIERLLAFVRRVVDESKPFLGVCYGHQTLARALEGKETVRKAAVPEIGWTRIELGESSPLTRGLPSEFHSFSSHFDEVARLPREASLLARSKACEIQAFGLRGKPVFGVQFHPEKNIEGADQVFARYRKKGELKRLMEPGRSRELYDAKVAETIFGNFFSIGN